MVNVNFKREGNPNEIQDFMSMASAEILVGFPSGELHVTDNEENEVVEMAELAKELSFGTAKIPARPFIEDGLKAHAEKLKQEIEKQVENAKENKANWDKVGAMAVGAVQEFVRGDYYKNTIPNSPQTIENKGSDKPLIGTALLINSLEYVVEK